ncbi:Aspartic proteinase nepenthesin-2 [Dendrobium catenatum]|uniref:Aspartic proteinase nepenthesin-2 n=1 Tax=Dendrobium catenatum TaxID=906689 RepID=A0A2I0WCZ8_9ASPA|nr:Aspartic proteinase nepenthesin-2 [Dendrobium catenatum]
MKPNQIFTYLRESSLNSIRLYCENSSESTLPPYNCCLSHYHVTMKSIGVAGTSLKLSTDIFQTGDMRGTIIDSGTTLAYLPEDAFKPLMNAVCSLSLCW